MVIGNKLKNLFDKGLPSYIKSTYSQIAVKNRSQSIKESISKASVVLLWVPLLYHQGGNYGKASV